MSRQAQAAAFYSLALAAVANAIVTPNLPYGGIVDTAGQQCKIGWALDTTGLWTNMSIELMTGDNLNFVHLTWVAHGLDGTTGDGSYTWTCPTVDPAAPIYFYQFTNFGQDATYTTRFTIANADGSTVDAPNPTQPDGQAIPWGTGKIVGGGGNSGGSTSGGGSGSSSSSVPGSRSSNPSNAGTSNTNSGASSNSGGNQQSTTIVTVSPTSARATTGTTAATRLTGSNVSSGVNANGNQITTSQATGSNGTGAAGRNTQGSMTAAVGLVLAVVAGLVIA